MIDNTSTSLISYPVISAAAIRLGKAQAAAVRLYDIVQTLARARNGYPFFTRAELIALNLLDEQQIDRALRAGLDLFWDRTSNGYHMISRAKVAVALGLEGKPGRAVLLPAKAFTGRLSNFKAFCYAGYLTQLHRQTPSREFLCDVFGVVLPTLLAWERKTGVEPRSRFVMADPATLKGATGQQNQAAAIYDEINRNSSPRKWITIVGPRRGVKAGRRLMDSDNNELDDYWSVTEEPAWEIGGQPMITWQTTNDYSDIPIPVAARGRGSWLHKEIKRLGSPGTMGKGDKSDQQANALDYQTRPGWQDDLYEAIKWQGRRFNRAKPAIVARYMMGLITGSWLPSQAALWGEII